MVQSRLATRVRLTGTLERVALDPDGSGYCLRIASSALAPASEQWFLEEEGFVACHEPYHDGWPEPLRPRAAEPLGATLERLVGQELTASGVLVDVPGDCLLVRVSKVRVAGLASRGVGLDAIEVRPRGARTVSA